jgi:hypothetical protein
LQELSEQHASVTASPEVRGALPTSVIKPPICPPGWLDLYMALEPGKQFIQNKNFVALGSQLINCYINKSRVGWSHDELHCFKELTSRIREKKQRKSMQEDFLHQRAFLRD